MTFKVRDNTRLEELTRDLNNELVRAVDKAMANQLRRLIKRTDRGEGVDGKFAPYTPEYRDWKVKEKGRNARPDLTLSGNMLANLTHKTKSSGGKITGRIGFTSLKERKKGEGNQKKRPFIGLKREEISEIVDELKKRIRGILK